MTSNDIAKALSEKYNTNPVWYTIGGYWRVEVDGKEYIGHGADGLREIWDKLVPRET